MSVNDKNKPGEGEEAAEEGSEAPARRRLLQILLGVGVITSGRMLPDQWVKPVVESITVPAHAQTSPPDDSGDDDDVNDDDDDDNDVNDDDDADDDDNDVNDDDDADDDDDDDDDNAIGP